MSFENLEYKKDDGKQSLNSDIGSFDKISLAKSISIEEDLLNSNKKDIRDNEKELSKNNENDSSEGNDIINLGSVSDFFAINLQQSEAINNKEININKISSFNQSELLSNKAKKNFLQKITEEHIDLEKLDKFDKEFSKKIHDCTLPKNVENIIYLFARMFNPDLITSYLVIIMSYKTFQNEPLFVLKPILSTIVTLLISLYLKKYIGRPRPEPSKISQRNYDLRKYEKNFSMPSGDSIQAGNWAIIIYFFTGYDFGFIIVPFVMFSRIYFYCHYLFDTIIGAVLGSLISLLINILIFYLV